VLRKLVADLEDVLFSYGIAEITWFWKKPMFSTSFIKELKKDAAELGGFHRMHRRARQIMKFW
jgi:hypothetical protein